MAAALLQSTIRLIVVLSSPCPHENLHKHKLNSALILIAVVGLMDEIMIGHIPLWILILQQYHIQLAGQLKCLTAHVSYGTPFKHQHNSALTLITVLNGLQR